MKTPLLVAVVLLLASVVRAAPIFVDGSLEPIEHSVTVYGGTLSPNWTNFPGTGYAGRLSPRYDGNPANWWDDLDGSWPIYVSWVTEAEGFGMGEPQEISPPQLLSDRAPVLFGSPGSPCFECVSWSVVATFDPAAPPGEDEEADTSDLYHGCGTRMEFPSGPYDWPFDANGNFRVKDIFGGTMEGTRIFLDFYVVGVGSVHHRMILVLGWDHPGTYKDAKTGIETGYTPGQIVNVKLLLEGIQGGTLKAHMPQLITNFASADFIPASPGFVDAGDLAGLAQLCSPATPVNWGFNPGHPGKLGASHNFKYNINPFSSSLGVIDSSDLSTLAVALGDDCGGASKADSYDASVIMGWFGMAQTGRSVPADASGTLIPEWDVVDRAQLQRAVADPYGYRVRPASARSETWGRVKRLYR